MVMRVAALLGMSIRQVERMDALEFMQWETYYAREPWGFQAWQLLSSKICQTIAAVVGEKTSLDNFRVLFDPCEAQKEAEPMSFEAISGVMNAVRSHLQHGNDGR